MATSRNKSVQFYTPKVKAAHTDLYAYSNGFAEACRGAINFETNLIFTLTVFLEDQNVKIKYLENEKSISGEIKNIFIIFKGFSVVKICLRLESTPLKCPYSTKSCVLLASIIMALKELG